ncbi:MAG: PAS domain S-box protein, partial [Actinoplanes sp.]
STALGLTVVLAMSDGDVDGKETFYSLTAILLVTVVGALLARRRELVERQARLAFRAASRLASLVEQSDDAIIGLDGDGTITSWNAGAQRLYGWSAEEAVGRPGTLIEPPELAGEQGSILQRAREGSRLDHFETVRLARDGRRLDVSESITPLVDGGGVVVGASMVGRDVTGRNEMVARLSDSEARKTAIFESALDAIVTIDHTGVVVDWNPAAERSFGWSAGEAVGRPLAELVVPADQRAAHTAGLARYLETGAGPMLGLRLELVAVHRDGHEIPVEVTITAVPMAGPPMFTGYLRDVTAQRAAEAERERLDRRLQQSERMDSLGQLAGGIAHDFNNLLAVILNYAAFVAEEITAQPGSAEPGSGLEAAGHDVGQIQRAAERASVLTHQLLAFARREVVQPRVLDLNDVVADMQQLLDRTIGEDVVLRTELAPDLSPVLADAGQIEQVLVNLAVNARDAMPGGGALRIETENVVAGGTSSPASRHIRLRVADTGTGIPADIIEHVFEPFYTTKGEGTGTGLGLATVYGIVTQAGGTIDIQSQDGVGTTFTIVLPATDEVAEPDPAPVAYERVHTDEMVLIVEDEEALREVTERIFIRGGFRVMTAANGVEAIALAAGYAGEIHLLLTDVVMPNMLGKEVAERVRELKPGIEVLYMSGYAQPVLASQGRLDRDVNLINKPFSADAITERAGQILNGHSRMQQRPPS